MNLQLKSHLKSIQRAGHQKYVRNTVLQKSHQKLRGYHVNVDAGELMDIQ